MYRDRQGLMAILALCFFVACSSIADAAQTHAFNPVLSLTGSCTTTPADSVMDPGCPGGVHPSNSFSRPSSVTTDAYGNIYVAGYGGLTAEGGEGRIDVFDSSGLFITEVADANGPWLIAVDGKGVLYVFEHHPGFSRVSRFVPSTYDPASAQIAYGNAPTTVVGEGLPSVAAVAVNPLNNHLFVHFASHVAEFGSADEGNAVLDATIGAGTLVNAGEGYSLAVDSAHGLLYASDKASFSEGIVRVFELGGTHQLLRTFDGSATPAGEFSREPSIAVDEGTGHFFVYDAGEEGQKAVFEFTESGEFVSTISYGIEDIGNAIGIRVDNGPNSPNGGLNPIGRYLYVPSHPVGVGHLFAYDPLAQCPADVTSVSPAEITRVDAELHATVDPCKAATSYTFELTTQARFLQEGFAGAAVVGGGQIPAEGGAGEVTAPAINLSPGTAYRFRVVATNDLGSDSDEGTFTTYASGGPSVSCPNDPFRIGFSAGLPDCRAYELVTPPDTNVRTPFALSHLGVYFTTSETSPSGNALSFQIEGGTIPGVEGGTGSLNGDPYLTTRGDGGWTTASAGPNGLESAAIVPGSVSPDQGYSFWDTGSRGTVAIGGKETAYVRYPDGHSELLGRGSLGTEPRAGGKLISEGGGHIIFISGGIEGSTPRRLEPEAPPSGTRAIYDRTADGVTHVVSLLPGDVTSPAGIDPLYEGASLDGRGVAFSMEDTLYLRYENKQTFEIGDGVEFAGVAEGGNRIFFVEGGKLRRFDALTGKTIDFNPTGTAIPVNVSADGSATYLVSTTVLTTKANPNKAKAKAGQQNLYFSREGAISFVATVTERDVEGEDLGNGLVDGLGLWVQYISAANGAPGGLAADPSRTTPDGHAIVFESRANLTAYDSDGRAQIYRYDVGSTILQCLSCNPTGVPAAGGASLQSLSVGRGDPEPLTNYSLAKNLRADGRRAFFQSTEALVPEDTDGLQDVYEWEDQGVGSCGNAGGCVDLISSGHSSRTDYLYAVSDSGDDVFLWTSDLLLPRDADETPSIYDARVGGGFPEPTGDACPVTQSCQGGSSELSFSTPASRGTGASGKVVKRCPKGKRKVKRHGKVRCVKKRHHRHKASHEKKGVAK